MGQDQPCIISGVKSLPRIAPAILQHFPIPFDHPDWLFELKLDGFSAAAYIEDGNCRLISRKEHAYKSFPRLCEAITRLPVKQAVLDGEVVCLDAHGRPVFDRLFYRQGTPFFYAFDVLRFDGRDLQSLPLVKRKKLLKQMVPAGSTVRYLDHVEEHGTALFRLVCERDLEGIVAKYARGKYNEPPAWLKIRNPNYTQMSGRREKFEGRR